MTLLSITHPPSFLQIMFITISEEKEKDRERELIVSKYTNSLAQGRGSWSGKKKKSSEFCRISETRNHPLSYTHTVLQQDVSEKQPSQGTPRAQKLRKPAWELWLPSWADPFSVGKPGKLPPLQESGIKVAVLGLYWGCSTTDRTELDPGIDKQGTVITLLKLSSLVQR